MSRVVMGEGGAGEGFPGGFGGFGVTPLIKERDITRWAGLRMAEIPYPKTS